jgi:hypothetical protein
VRITFRIPLANALGLSILALSLAPTFALAGYSADNSRAIPPSELGELLRILPGNHATVELAVENFVRHSFHKQGFRVENKAGQGDMLDTNLALRSAKFDRLPKEDQIKIGRWVRLNGAVRALSFRVSMNQHGGESGADFLALLPNDPRADVFLIQTDSYTE